MTTAALVIFLLSQKMSKTLFIARQLILAAFHDLIIYPVQFMLQPLMSLFLWLLRPWFSNNETSNSSLFTSLFELGAFCVDAVLISTYRQLLTAGTFKQLLALIVLSSIYAVHFVVSSVFQWMQQPFRQKSGKSGAPVTISPEERRFFDAMPYTSPLSIVRPSESKWMDTLSAESHPFEANYFHLSNGMRVHFMDVQLYYPFPPSPSVRSNMLSRTSFATAPSQLPGYHRQTTVYSPIFAGSPVPESTAAIADDNEDPLTILMVHGRHSWSHVFRNVIACLADAVESNPASRPLRLVAVDLPGYGRSDTLLASTEFHLKRSMPPSSMPKSDEDDTVSVLSQETRAPASPYFPGTPQASPYMSRRRRPTSASSQRVHRLNKQMSETSSLWTESTRRPLFASAVKEETTPIDMVPGVLDLHVATVMEAWTRFQPAVIMAHDYGCLVTLAAKQRLTAAEHPCVQRSKLMLVQPAVMDQKPTTLTTELLQRMIVPSLKPSMRIASTEERTLVSYLRYCHEAWQNGKAYDIPSFMKRDGNMKSTIDPDALLHMESPFPVLDDVLVQRLREIMPALEHAPVLGALMNWNNRYMGQWCRDVLSQAATSPVFIPMPSISEGDQDGSGAISQNPSFVKRGNLYTVGSFSAWAHPSAASSSSSRSSSRADGEQDPLQRPQYHDTVWVVTSVGTNMKLEREKQMMLNTWIQAPFERALVYHEAHPDMPRLVGRIDGRETGYLPEHQPEHTAQWLLKMLGM